MNQAMTESKANSLDLTSESYRYWQQHLAGSPPLLELPTDKLRQSLIASKTSTHNVYLSASLMESLQALSNSQEVSLFVTLLAAFQVLLYRYTDRQDILVGSPIMRRDLDGLPSPVIANNLVGSSLETTKQRLRLLRSVQVRQPIVLRTDLSGNPSFLEVLQRVERVVTAAHAHQYLPFDRLLEALEIEPLPSYHPLFQVMLSLEQTKNTVLDRPSPGVTSSPVFAILPVALDIQEPRSTPIKNPGYSSESSHLDLVFKLTQTPTGIAGYVEYRTDLFNPETIGRLVANFQVLLTGIILNSARAIGELPLLTDRERQQLLVDWNDTKVEYPTLCVHQLFEAQVLKTPGAIAVVFGTDRLTYTQLNLKCNQLAHYLGSVGVGTGSLVGICVERSVEMIVGLLGVLKAGGAYVPIDPNYPPDRIADLLDDSQVQVLLTQSRLLKSLPPHTATSICLDTDWDTIAQQPSANLDRHLNFADLAYVIYTSGSTGKPKGVKIHHQGFANYLNWCIKAYTVAQGSGAPVQSSISFDATITSIFSPLLVGQKVVLLPERNEIEALVSLLESSTNFSLVKITPAHLEILKYLLKPAVAPDRTRALIVGGEALLGNNLAFWRDHAPNTRIINEYGPTETVVGCCVYEVTKDTCLSAAIPIGRPIANTQLYVLDRLLQPVPIGVKGELYIGGDGVAQGYWRRADLTTERFIANPFSQDPHARLYKTGDLARYLPDGNLDYLGRIDHQVKIRGFRIELGEIETTLAQHPDVERLVVVVNDDIPGNRRLVAYIVPQANRQPTIYALRQFMAQKLPEHAVPAVFMTLAEFPLTPNGKVDRAALPAPESIRTKLAADLIAPRDELELALTKIWERVLAVESIGIGENFFELGGNSLIAVRLVAAIDLQWQRKIGLSTLLQHPTIAELAKILHQAQADTTWSSLVQIESSGSKLPLFCIHPVGGNILEYYPFARLSLDRPIYGLQALGLDGLQAPLSQIEEMAAHYINEIETVQPNGPYFLVGYSFGGLVAFEIACQLTSQGKQIGLLALLDNVSPNLPKVRPSLAQVFGIHLRNLQQLSMNERVKYIKDRIIFRTMYANKENSEREFLLDNWAESLPLEYLAVMEANLQASKNYTGRIYSGDVTLFRSDIQPVDQSLHLDLGWNNLVGGKLTIKELPGHHTNILKEPHIQLLGRELKLSLD
jgi:amino acid adenylation domain-containing protein